MSNLNESPIDLSTMPDTDEDHESTYRRGYSDGWIVAIDTIHDLMFQEHMSRQQAYDALWDFWETGELWKWQQSSLLSFEFPPQWRHKP